MPADDRQRQEEIRRAALAAAQGLERRGLHDAAIQAYKAAEAPEEAARVLMSQRRFGEAAQLLIDTVGVPPEMLAAQDAAKKKMALQAAICFGRASEAIRAATIFVALGERERAVDMLRRSGDQIAADRVLSGGPVTLAAPTSSAATQASAQAMAQALALEQSSNFDLAMEAYLQLRQPHHAARMAVKLGRLAQAAELFAAAGMHFEAAEAFWRSGDQRKSLDMLLRVPRDDQRYRQCALLVIRLASDLDILDFQVDHFLTKLLTDAPQNEREVEAFYAIARLYQRHDHLDNARSAYQRIAMVAPNYRDVRAQLDAIGQESRGSAMVYEKILREEEAFRGATIAAVRGPGGLPLADLPELPELPSLPEVPTREYEAQTVPTVPQSVRSQLTPPPPPRAPVSRPSVPARQVQSSPPTPAATVVPTSAPAAAMTADSLLTIGSVVADRYRLEAKIGQGGMATVFRAHDLELNEQIALKCFTQKVDDEQLVGRFKQELSLSRQLNHPNIIRLYDIGMVAGFRYITMELLDGTDLKSKLGKPIPQEVGVAYLLQCCAALQHVHEKGVVHRDIKPANLFLTSDGVIKLMDFGIAKRQATPGLTVAGMIAGTPEYMSPEQINGFEKVTASTDLYALGIMAYEIFTGVVPFKHKELMPLLVMHMKDKPPSPRARNPSLSADLEEIILKLLEKDPGRRFASCTELAAALQLL